LKILVTGEKGYIAGAITSKLLLEGYEVQNVSLKTNNISSLNLEPFDTIIHTAALVHKKESDYLLEDYLEINYQLTINLATIAKLSGVKQFVFISTMAVFGKEQGEIDINTKLQPITNYGISKLRAEKELLKLQDDRFNVTIIRPPMVYGPNCPGNYQKLRLIAKISPIFPMIKNKRSMIFIENLTEFIFLILKNRRYGIFHPQDSEYICTSEMVKLISKCYEKNIYLSKALGFLITKLFSKHTLFQKVFGDLYYSKKLSEIKDLDYCKYNLLKAITFTEMAKEDER